MNIKTEDLLKPRFKLIADYPGNSYPIGHVSVEVPTASYFRRFKANFRELEWWEEREEKDMPKYIMGRHRGDEYPLEVIKWDMEYGSYPKTTVYDIEYYAPYCRPITEKEYKEYGKR